MKFYIKKFIKKFNNSVGGAGVNSPTPLSLSNSSVNTPTPLNSNKNHFIIAADTILYSRKTFFHKTNDKDEAYKNLRLLSGRRHRIYTGLTTIDSNYKNKVTSYLKDISYKNDILGVITQKNEINDPKVLYFTPGVNTNCKTDQNDQNYRSPEDAIKRDNCDIIIVGRGISHADDPIKTAILYKNLSWNAYLEKFTL